MIRRVMNGALAARSLTDYRNTEIFINHTFSFSIAQNIIPLALEVDLEPLLFHFSGILFGNNIFTDERFLK